MMNLFIGKPLAPVGASKETREAIHRLDKWYFETMGCACGIKQTDEIDRAYDEVRAELDKAI